MAESIMFKSINAQAVLFSNSVRFESLSLQSCSSHLTQIDLSAINSTTFLFQRSVTSYNHI